MPRVPTVYFSLEKRSELDMDLHGFHGQGSTFRCPLAVVLKEAALGLKQRATRGRIVIESSERVGYSLDELLAGITPRSAHEEVSFGKPVGKEAL